jgi:hypothetical protein
MGFDSDRIWRCDCMDGHFISITSFDAADRDGETIEALRYFSIDGHFAAPTRRARLRQLWRMLRKGKTESWVGVVLNHQTMVEIRDELNRLIDKASHEQEVTG